MHIEAIGYSAIAPGAAGAAASAVTGDSLTILNDTTRHANIIDWRAKNQAVGFHRVIFPTAHDTTKNMTSPVTVSNMDPLEPWGLALQPTRQELLSITIAGSAVAGDVESGWFNILYPDVPGLSGRYIDWGRVLQSAEKEMTIFATLNGSAAGWSGTELITSDSDLMQADRDYACLGMRVSTDIAAVALRGPDNASRRIACPGQSTKSFEGQNYFANLSRAYRLPMIPVVASGNKSNTFIEMLCDENTPVVNVALYMVLLAPGWKK